MKSKQKQEVVATSVFLVEHMTMKKDLIFRLKLTLKTVLPEAFREYTVVLSHNDEPYLMRVEDLRNRLAEVNKEVQLFPAEKKKQLKTIEQQIADVENELHDAQAECPDIEFEAAIEQLTYKDSDTVVVLTIPASVVADIAEKRIQLHNYKVELLRNAE